jgi:hypothetical protein
VADALVLGEAAGERELVAHALTLGEAAGERE